MRIHTTDLNAKSIQSDQNQNSITNIENEFDWLRKLIHYRIAHHFNGQETLKTIGEIPAPDLYKSDSHYADFIISHNLGLEERALLALSLVPHLSPNFLDDVIQAGLGKAGDFPEIGGVRGKNHRGFLPTGETVLFILAGNNIQDRIMVQDLFKEEHFFYKNQVLWLEEPNEGEPRMSGRIILNQEHVELFTQGIVSSPRFGINFPAQRIHTHMEWDDLVLNEQTMQQIRELEIWVKHGKTLLTDWGMNRKLRPGYRALFHGPPGTGKTLTATLLGKYTGKDVYKIDLSLVISKYIGETEKNLSNLFDRAANKDWILFFDEADALFGKRTGVKDAHDKYANQEVSYLLQRTEDYPGLVILASNFKSNIDESFTRRFQSFIYFPLPKPSERLELWKKAFPEKITLSSDINLIQLSQQFELSGADIMNIVQHVCLNALSEGTLTISNNNILKSIQREFIKTGKIC